MSRESSPHALPHLRLTGRSSSHFTRVARLFAHELGVPYEFQVVHDLASVDPAVFGDHPSLKMPTLRTGDAMPVFGTENICRALVELAGHAGDPRFALPEHTPDPLVRAAQEIVWSAMASQVQLRVGVSVAKLPADNVFFVKASASLDGGLGWLEGHVDDVLARLPAGRTSSLFEASLFCLVEHILFLPTVALTERPTLCAFAARYATRDAAKATVFHFDPRPPTRST